MGIIAQNVALAEELTRYAHLCYDRHLVGAAGGNLSVRLPGKDAFLVTASGVSLRDVAPGNLLAVEINGNVLENPARLNPSKEAGFHFAIYDVKPEINAVIHVHPTYSTAYAVLGQPIPLATISARLKLRQGAVVPEAPPGSLGLRRNVMQAVEGAGDRASVLLLERHGLVAYAPTLREAFDDAELAEDTAKIAFLCGQAASPAPPDMEGAIVVDLTAPLNEHMPIYPGDPFFRKIWHVAFKDGGSCVSKMELGAHTGTHVDAPLHYIEKGTQIDAMPPASFFGPAIALHTPKMPGERITPADFTNSDIRAGDIVLFHTGWEVRSGSPGFFEDNWPDFTLEAVDTLVAMKVKAIGGDIASADNPIAIREGSPAHKKALSAGIPIFEALVNLKAVVGRRFFFMGLPLRIEGGEASPIRAIAVIVG